MAWRMEPRADASLDHSIGALEDGRWKADTQGFRCSQIEHQLEASRLFDRQRSGVCALENLIDVAPRGTVLFDQAERKRHQAARLGEVGESVHGRLVLTVRQGYDTLAFGEHEWARHQIKQLERRVLADIDSRE